MHDLLKTRRSIRKFDPRAVEESVLSEIAESLLKLPSGRDIRPCEFIFTTDRDKIRALSEAKQFGSSFAAGAPAAVIILADPEKTDTWLEEAGMAAATAHYLTSENGLGSCWIQLLSRKTPEGGSSEERVRELFGVPSKYKAAAAVVFGYAAENPGRKETGAEDLKRIHREHFSCS